MKKATIAKCVIIIALVNLSSCSTKSDKITMDIQGHRGCRGLYPENTVQGFLKALDLGVTTLEMDVVISKDGKVVVSHEPFFNHEIATGPNGEEITKKSELSFNMYEMDYNQISEFDVGLKLHPRFPDQEKVAEKKPLLLDVIQAAEAHAKKNELPAPHYNIELKRLADYDNVYHPGAEAFSKLVLYVIEEAAIENRTSLQAFDISTLQMLKELNSEILLVLLIENDLSIKENIKKLGFKPDIYSPDKDLVDVEMVTYCKKQKVKLIPWTVNKEEDIEKMIDFGVDGIISDYPDRVIGILTK